MAAKKKTEQQPPVKKPKISLRRAKEMARDSQVSAEAVRKARKRT